MMLNFKIYKWKTVIFLSENNLPPNFQQKVTFKKKLNESVFEIFLGAFSN